MSRVPKPSNRCVSLCASTAGANRVPSRLILPLRRSVASTRISQIPYGQFLQAERPRRQRPKGKVAPRASGHHQYAPQKGDSVSMDDIDDGRAPCAAKAKSYIPKTAPLKVTQWLLSGDRCEKGAHCHTRSPICFPATKHCVVLRHLRLRPFLHNSHSSIAQLHRSCAL